MLLSQVDYLATSNSALESVWRSPLPTAKFMISSFDAFLRPFRMRVPLIGFGDSAAACKHGRSVGAHILRRISQKYPVESFGTCMKNYDASWFVPNLGVSASSAETIRTQLQLSKYLFYYVAEEVDCPGHVTEKLWLPLLRGSIPVYFGTKTVDDYLPCPKKDCVLRVKDFDSVDALVRRMREIADDQKLSSRSPRGDTRCLQTGRNVSARALRGRRLIFKPSCATSCATATTRDDAARSPISPPPRRRARLG